MSDIAVLERIETLTKTLTRLESRVQELEDHEDLRDLEKAVAQNGDKPLVPWNKASALLEMD